MSSYKLFSDQVDRINSRRCPGIDILRAAVRRYRDGSLVIQKEDSDKIGDLYYFRKETAKQLVVFPVRERFDGINDFLMRRILDAHFLTPDSELEKEYQKATRQAEMLFKEHTKKPFIVA